MVKLTTIRQSNARYASSQHDRRVCVFAGATSGIGASTLERMATMLQNPTFYVLGRSAARFASQRANLERLAPNCKVVFLETQVSLLADVDAACEQILAAEQRVDYLYMSPGLIPLNGAQYTQENLETCFSLSYYARMRLLSNLLPLLRSSPRPRILSVLNAGKETALHTDDLGLSHTWSPLTVVAHTTTMTSLAFEHLAATEPQITFLHSYPGWVRTDIFAHLTAPESSGTLWRAMLALIQSLVAVLMYLMGMSVEESGERQAYLLTTEEYAPGAWRVGAECDVVAKEGVLAGYREGGWPEKVWDHTLRVFEKALVHSSNGVAP